MVVHTVSWVYVRMYVPGARAYLKRLRKADGPRKPRGARVREASQCAQQQLLQRVGAWASSFVFEERASDAVWCVSPHAPCTSPCARIPEPALAPCPVCQPPEFPSSPSCLLRAAASRVAGIVCLRRAHETDARSGVAGSKLFAGHPA